MGALVGNETDLSEGVVTKNKGKTLPENHNAGYIEIIIKDKTNLDEPFVCINTKTYCPKDL